MHKIWGCETNDEPPVALKGCNFCVCHWLNSLSLTSHSKSALCDITTGTTEATLWSETTPLAMSWLRPLIFVLESKLVQGLFNRKRKDSLFVFLYGDCKHLVNHVVFWSAVANRYFVNEKKPPWLLLFGSFNSNHPAGKEEERCWCCHTGTNYGEFFFPLFFLVTCCLNSEVELRLLLCPCCFQGDGDTFHCHWSETRPDISKPTDSLFFSKGRTSLKTAGTHWCQFGGKKERGKKTECILKARDRRTCQDTSPPPLPLKPDILLGALSPAEEHGGCRNKKRKKKKGKNLRILLKVSPGEKEQF